MSQAINLSQMQAGFAEPVANAQTCFRAVIEALSRPGSIVQLNDLPLPPPGLGAAQAAILLTLADTDTPVWLPPELREAEAGHWLRFYCGCPLSTKLDEAHFVALRSLAELPSLQRLRLGEPAFPDRSATLLVEVGALETDGPLRLTGPGIEHAHHLRVAGWSETVDAFMDGNHCRFPLGVDLLLCCGDRLAGLPRTTTITGEA